MPRMLIFLSIIYLSFTFISCKPDNRIDISAGWRIKLGDSPEFKNAGFDDSSWDRIDLPKILTTENKRKIIWLRKTFFVPADFKDNDLAVEIGKIWDADNTYLNGIKIGSSGSENPVFFSLWNYDRHYTIPDQALRVGETNVLTIRIFSNCKAFFDGSPFISTTHLVRTYNFFQRLAAEYIVIALTVLSIFFGIISMVQYFSNREFKLPLYYSICSLMIGIVSIEFYLPDLSYISYITKDNIFYAILSLVISFFYFLLEKLLYTRNRVFQIILIIAMFIAIGLSLTATFDDPVQGWRIVVISSMTTIAYILCGILLFRALVKNKVNKEVVILTGGYLINMCCVFHDIVMMQSIIPPGTFLMPVAFNLQFVCFGMVLSLRSSDIYTAKIIAEQFRDRYLNEINMAKKIQEQLIPSGHPAKYIHSFYKPMEDVGGDFYDYIRFENSDNIGVFISDVSGHGLPAAFITSMLKTTILQSGARKENPAELLTYINEVLQDQTAGNFITAFYGIYNPVHRSIKYSNAGHPQPYVIDNEKVSLLPKGRSTALALFPNNLLSGSHKVYKNFEVILQSNTKLLLFTDGLTETSPANNGKIFFESEGLLDFFMENRKYQCKKFIENLYHKLIEFRGSDLFEDDICMICIDIN